MKRIILSLGVALALMSSTGCASALYRGHVWDPSVRPGPYPGVRMDVKTIASLTDAVKTAKGSDKLVVACCVPVGAALFTADMPLSAVADSFTLPADLNDAMTRR